MDLELTKEHLMLQESVSYFVKKEHSFDRLRELKEDDLGYSKKIWKKMVKLGWTELLVPEKYGGQELGLDYVMVLLEEFGKVIVPEPFISTVVLGGNLVNMGGSDMQKKEILSAIAAGKLFIALAYLEENGRFDACYCETTAKKNEDGFLLSGKKIFVLDGIGADKYIVSARTKGSVSSKDGITLFIIPADADGLKIKPIKTMDGKNASILEFDDVKVKDIDLLGEVDSGYQILSEALDQATACICAEMIGGMKATIDLTLQHISNRVQFGKPIGTFQVLQHKAADMFIQKELAVSATYYAMASMVEKSDTRSLAVSTAKAKCSAVYVDIAKAAVQMSGAFGYTNEADVGFFLKRAKVTEILFGDVSYHLDRCASLEGY